jgi:hypothetical protein
VFIDLFIVECEKKEKMEGGGSKSKTMKNGRRSNRERKIALLQDVF